MSDLKVETNVRKLLRKARNLIRKPENWIRDRLAETEDGIYTRYDEPDAAKFCVMGALGRVLKEEADTSAWYDTNNVMKIILKKNNFESITQLVDFNNNLKTKHEDIMMAFDKAINSCNSKKEIK